MSPFSQSYQHVIVESSAQYVDIALENATGGFPYYLDTAVKITAINQVTGEARTDVTIHQKTHTLPGGGYSPTGPGAIQVINPWNTDGTTPTLVEFHVERVTSPSQDHDPFPSSPVDTRSLARNLDKSERTTQELETLLRGETGKRVIDSIHPFTIPSSLARASTVPTFDAQGDLLLLEDLSNFINFEELGNHAGMVLGEEGNPVEKLFVDDIQVSTDGEIHYIDGILIESKDDQGNPQGNLRVSLWDGDTSTWTEAVQTYYHPVNLPTPTTFVPSAHVGKNLSLGPRDHDFARLDINEEPPGSGRVDQLGLVMPDPNNLDGGGNPVNDTFWELRRQALIGNAAGSSLGIPGRPFDEAYLAFPVIEPYGYLRFSNKVQIQGLDQFENSTGNLRVRFWDEQAQSLVTVLQTYFDPPTTSEPIWYTQGIGHFGRGLIFGQTPEDKITMYLSAGTPGGTDINRLWFDFNGTAEWSMFGRFFRGETEHSRIIANRVATDGICFIETQGTGNSTLHHIRRLNGTGSGISFYSVDQSNTPASIPHMHMDETSFHPEGNGLSAIDLGKPSNQWNNIRARSANIGGDAYLSGSANINDVDVRGEISQYRRSVKSLTSNYSVSSSDSGCVLTGQYIPSITVPLTLAVGTELIFINREASLDMRIEFSGSTLWGFTANNNFVGDLSPGGMLHVIKYTSSRWRVISEESMSWINI